MYNARAKLLYCFSDVRVAVVIFLNSLSSLTWYDIIAEFSKTKCYEAKLKQENILKMRVIWVKFMKKNEANVFFFCR